MQRLQRHAITQQLVVTSHTNCHCKQVEIHLYITRRVQDTAACSYIAIYCLAIALTCCILLSQPPAVLYISSANQQLQLISLQAAAVFPSHEGTIWAVHYLVSSTAADTRAHSVRALHHCLFAQHCSIHTHACVRTQMHAPAAAPLQTNAL